MPVCHTFALRWLIAASCCLCATANFALHQHTIASSGHRHLGLGDSLDEWGHQGPGLEGGHQHGRGLLEDAMPSGPACPAMSNELLDVHAKNETVLIMCIDRVLFKRFAHSWIQNVKAAGIKYWFVAAMDPWSSMALGALGVSASGHCFNAPVKVATGGAASYQWGNLRWHKTTWKKVHVIKAVYGLGYHVVHSDADSTWWSDPYQWLHTHVVNSHRHAIFSTDSLNTQNINKDKGPEASTSPFFNINTGIYFIKQYGEGLDFFDVWLKIEAKNSGHDQDGLNEVVRGRYARGDNSLPEAKWEPENRLITCALHTHTNVGLLPVHLFGNAYTYNIGRVHELLNATLFVTHWVWTGGSPESKIQHMRDAMSYVDSPTWYGLPPGKDDALYEYTEQDHQAKPDPLMLISMALDVPKELPENYNWWPMDRTEDMIRYHVKQAVWQMQQAYWGILAAAGLGRTLVLPDFQCYCTKNWYMTQACRINGEHHTRFPFHCSLSDLFRAKKMLSGIEVPLTGSTKMVVHIRERGFLTNPQVPQEIKSSKLIIQAGTPLVSGPADPASITNLKPTKQADGSRVVSAPWPLTAEELNTLISSVAGGPYRHVHLANATQLVGRGFADPGTWAAFDTTIEKYKTYWCCRSPSDQDKYKLGARETYTMLPASRQKTT